MCFFSVFAAIFLPVARKKFNPRPFAYHQEIELEITTLTNLGAGLGRVPLAEALAPATSDLALPAANAAGWVVMVAFALPGERVRARVFLNHSNYSEADLVDVLTPSPHRVAPRCPLFGRCGGCQYQNLAYAEQLHWKQRQVRELLEHMGGVEFEAAPVIASPREFGYRSKITPHFPAPQRGNDGPSSQDQVLGRGESVMGAPIPSVPSAFALRPSTEPAIGFLRQGSRYEIVDVPHCEIATDAINARLTQVRDEVRARASTGGYVRGSTLLLREASGIVTTDYDSVITEIVGDLQLRFLARDFFQNNPFILPVFAGYVRDQAVASGAQFLVDAYCGSGLFALTAAPHFERVAGVEVSETSVAYARENAVANGITNATFLAGDAAAIFAGLAFPSGATAVVIDPPRKGCDELFLCQLLTFAPRAVVYISCDPATQMRDLRHFLAGGYTLTAVQPFDLFPQTRHLECVITLRNTG